VDHHNHNLEKDLHIHDLLLVDFRPGIQHMMSWSRQQQAVNRAYINTPTSPPCMENLEIEFTGPAALVRLC